MAQIVGAYACHLTRHAKNRAPLTSVAFSIQKDFLPSPRWDHSFFRLTIASLPILGQAYHNLRRQRLRTKCRFLTVLWRLWRYWQTARVIAASRSCAQP